jgi:hypothetical protein
MERMGEQQDREGVPSHQAGRSRALWIGIAAAAMALALVARPVQKHKARRHSDRLQERRNPLHFFHAGNYPRRRAIDRSGLRPLFERRQSVYEAY